MKITGDLENIQKIKEVKGIKEKRNMQKLLFKTIAILVVFVMVFNFFPPIVVAATNYDKNTKPKDPPISEEKEEVKIVTEDTSKRTETEKYFILEDGTQMVAMYDSVVHYEKDGKMEEINNSLEEIEDNGEMQLDETEDEEVTTQANEETFNTEENQEEEQQEEKEEAQEESENTVEENIVTKETKNKNVTLSNQTTNEVNVTNTNDIAKDNNANDSKNQSKSNSGNSSNSSNNSNNSDHKNAKSESTNENNNLKKKSKVYQNKSGTIKTKFSKQAKNNNLVSIKDKEENYQIKWSIKKPNNSNLEVLDIEEAKSSSENEEKVTVKNLNSAVIYKDILNNIDLKYDVLSEGVKENIILKNKDAANTSIVFEYKVRKLKDGINKGEGNYCI